MPLIPLALGMSITSHHFAIIRVYRGKLGIRGKMGNLGNLNTICTQTLISAIIHYFYT